MCRVRIPGSRRACWGIGTAHRLEWLLNGAKWDADTLRDQVRAYVVGHLGSPDGVLVADAAAAVRAVSRSRWQRWRGLLPLPGPSFEEPMEGLLRLRTSWP